MVKSVCALGLSITVCDRGPVQLLRNETDARGKMGGLSEQARATLAEMMAEGLGDHILMLRLFQVRIQNIPYIESCVTSCTLQAVLLTKQDCAGLGEDRVLSQVVQGPGSGCARHALCQGGPQAARRPASTCGAQGAS